MPISRHYEATDSHGVTHTRQTARKDRNYTHVTVARGHCTYGDKLPFTDAEWSSTREGADANARKWRRKAHVTAVEVIPARMVRETGRE